MELNPDSREGEGQWPWFHGIKGMLGSSIPHLVMMANLSILRVLLEVVIFHMLLSLQSLEYMAMSWQMAAVNCDLPFIVLSLLDMQLVKGSFADNWLRVLKYLFGRDIDIRYTPSHLHDLPNANVVYVGMCLGSSSIPTMPTTSLFNTLQCQGTTFISVYLNTATD
ncbi:hypothetical protein VNO78_19065 [Psophocarpus tetragonolobus]|uniref:Uncharacterized protein n=1 Tax=Psophocarpus tetragonolobus TaxID=3891 RepID=A0AAN9S782_PSOTE